MKHVSHNRGHKELAKLLFAYNANIEDHHPDGHVLLYFTVGYENVGRSSLLLQDSIFINRKKSYAFTPLVRAAVPGDKAVVEVLLDKGVDIEKSFLNKCGWESLQNCFS